MKAVIFDLDGVITDTAELHYEAWRELAEGIGIAFDRQFNEELKGISRMESLEKILAYGGKVEHFSVKEKRKLAEQKNEHYVALLRQIGPKDILPGVKVFLEELIREGMQLGVASASKNAPAILAALGLTEYFATIADPDKVAKGKPSPDIFLWAAENLGVSARDCVGIEDSTAGIVSIKAADMFAVGVGTPDVMKASGADLVLSSTSELRLAEISAKVKSVKGKQFSV